MIVRPHAVAADITAEWLARGARMLPSGAVVTSLGDNTAEFRKRVREAVRCGWVPSAAVLPADSAEAA